MKRFSGLFEPFQVVKTRTCAASPESRVGTASVDNPAYQPAPRAVFFPLPAELLIEIAAYLTSWDLLSLCQTNKFIYSVISKAAKLRSLFYDEELIERSIDLPPLVVRNSVLLPLLIGLQTSEDVAKDRMGSRAVEVDRTEQDTTPAASAKSIERLILSIPAEVQRRRSESPTTKNSALKPSKFTERVYLASALSTTEAQAIVKPEYAILKYFDSIQPQLRPYLESLVDLRLDFIVPEAIVDRSDWLDSLGYSYYYLGEPKDCTASGDSGTIKQTGDLLDLHKYINIVVYSLSSLSTQPLKVQYRIRSTTGSACRIISLNEHDVKPEYVFSYRGTGEMLEEVRSRSRLEEGHVVRPERLLCGRDERPGAKWRKGLCDECCYSCLLGLTQYTLINRTRLLDKKIPIISSSSTPKSVLQDLGISTKIFTRSHKKSDEDYRMFEQYIPIQLKKTLVPQSRLSYLHLEGVLLWPADPDPKRSIFALLCPHTSTLVLRDSGLSVATEGQRSWYAHGLWNQFFRQAVKSSKGPPSNKIMAKRVEISRLWDPVQGKYPHWLERLWEQWIENGRMTAEEEARAINFQSWD